MAEHHAVDIDPKELERAQNTWAGFTSLLKYAVLGSVATLALLGLAFIDW